MPKEKTAIFWIVFEARHVSGSVEIHGVPESEASFLSMDGFERTQDGYRLHLRTGLKKRWEDRVASTLLNKLRAAVDLYGVTRWWAGNNEAYTAAEPDFQSQMRHWHSENQ
ncbi:hypothetical protein ACFFLM_00435 [Deinococcus oregonensis]|uniref:Uncharacterized protein n=1 Tax=Deinococcus oregonensis TaxID=1805970 RepID=A0ABV6ASJ3_9DEIO